MDWKRIISERFKKFIVVGLAATAIHYAFLNLFVLVWPSVLVWKLNVLAAAFGIMASYLGNRCFVFLSKNSALPELARFFGSYTFVGIAHTAVMYVMVDFLGVALTAGFVLATAAQVVLSYSINRAYVFSGT